MKCQNMGCGKPAETKVLLGNGQKQNRCQACADKRKKAHKLLGMKARTIQNTTAQANTASPT